METKTGFYFFGWVISTSWACWRERTSAECSWRHAAILSAPSSPCNLDSLASDFSTSRFILPWHKHKSVSLTTPLFLLLQQDEKQKQNLSPFIRLICTQKYVKWRHSHSFKGRMEKKKNCGHLSNCRTHLQCACFKKYGWCSQKDLCIPPNDTIYQTVIHTQKYVDWQHSHSFKGMMEKKKNCGHLSNCRTHLQCACFKK